MGFTKQTPQRMKIPQRQDIRLQMENAMDENTVLNNSPKEGDLSAGKHVCATIVRNGACSDKRLAN
jgi:hypothetical protein